ncbi:MAG: hypothetical protein C0611_12430 [Desulfobacteraceae bacterium]|nr:MAG: hypothetical protein C0611_12430 [Desulfobacteraceae bacterium]
MAGKKETLKKSNHTESNKRVFSISFEAARSMVKKAGEMVGVHLRPHDLSRHAATYSSRAGIHN